MDKLHLGQIFLLSKGQASLFIIIIFRSGLQLALPGIVSEMQCVRSVNDCCKDP